MKYHFNYFIPKAAGILPLEESVTITKRGIQAGKKLREALGFEKYKYVRIGIDEAVSTACIEPTIEKDGAFSITREFGGKYASEKLLEVVGKKPYVTIESGVAILSPPGPVENKTKGDTLPKEATTTLKKRGRPPKIEVDTKESCLTCDYHQQIVGTTARIKCEKTGHTKNFDDYCF
ncbi:MAG: hypothetical protein ACQ5SW_12345, partial [Sphaerochaetaceae bacterium]